MSERDNGRMKGGENIDKTSRERWRERDKRKEKEGENRYNIKREMEREK